MRTFSYLAPIVGIIFLIVRFSFDYDEVKDSNGAFFATSVIVFLFIPLFSLIYLWYKKK